MIKPYRKSFKRIISEEYEDLWDSILMTPRRPDNYDEIKKAIKLLNDLKTLYGIED